MKQTAHKALSLLLTAALALNLGLVPVFAQEAPQGASALTDCHTAHDSACGYRESSTTGGCTHAHGDDCGYREGTTEQPCNLVPEEESENLYCKGWMSNPLLKQQDSQIIRSRMKRFCGKEHRHRVSRQAA